ncbi:UNVERIFIED_CONTAM: hypothetical protein HDU68_011399 [Siphonaria sp. JEL0065]|nr:hypothetical protein HDU68_011399 [Siphonaria sp. JEL0065]
MTLQTAFTIYFAGSGCTAPAVKISYDQGAACAPSSVVSECLPSTLNPKWFTRTGCIAGAIDYTDIGNKYLGSGLQVQYQRTSSDKECDSFPTGGYQYPLGTCVPNIENKTIQRPNGSAVAYQYESSSVSLVFDGEVGTSLSQSPECESTQEAYSLRSNITTPSNCYSHKLINSHWFREVVYENGDCSNPSNTISIQIGRSINTTCVPTTTCSKESPYTRTCMQEYKKSDHQLLFGSMTPKPYADLNLVDCSQSHTYSMSVQSVLLDRCIPRIGGGSQKSRVTLTDKTGRNGKRYMYIDTVVYAGGDCSGGILKTMVHDVLDTQEVWTCLVSQISAERNEGAILWNYNESSKGVASSLSTEVLVMIVVGCACFVFGVGSFVWTLFKSSRNVKIGKKSDGIITL